MTLNKWFYYGIAFLVLIVPWEINFVSELWVTTAWELQPIYEWPLGLLIWQWPLMVSVFWFDFFYSIYPLAQFPVLAILTLRRNQLPLLLFQISGLLFILSAVLSFSIFGEVFSYVRLVFLAYFFSNTIAGVFILPHEKQPKEYLLLAQLYLLLYPFLLFFIVATMIFILLMFAAGFRG